MRQHPQGQLAITRAIGPRTEMNGDGVRFDAIVRAGYAFSPREKTASVPVIFHAPILARKASSRIGLGLRESGAAATGTVV